MAADYYKVNAHVYFFSWIEAATAGVQGLFLIDTNAMHDVGCFFGINWRNRFESHTTGAKGYFTDSGLFI